MTLATRPLWQRRLFVVAGTLSFGLGLLGVALPLLPTVPFLILTAYCYARGSTRLLRWLVRHPTYGPLLSAWHRERAVPLRGKLACCLLLVGSAIASVLAESWSPTLRAVLLGVVALIALFVLTRPTARPKATRASRRPKPSRPDPQARTPQAPPARSD